MTRSSVTPRSSMKMIWHVFPRDGASGNLKTDYYVERGLTQTLGRYDMVDYEGQKMHIAPDQCIVQAAEDGSCIYVYAQGQQPTGWRTGPYEPWTWMQPGESVALTTGHKVSLDASHPEAAVFKFEKESPQTAAAMRGEGQQLPPGWVQGVDNGQTYYFNQQTGQSQWEPPRL